MIFVSIRYHLSALPNNFQKLNDTI